MFWTMTVELSETKRQRFHLKRCGLQNKINCTYMKFDIT